MTLMGMGELKPTGFRGRDLPRLTHTPHKDTRSFSDLERDLPAELLGDLSEMSGEL